MGCRYIAYGEKVEEGLYQMAYWRKACRLRRKMPLLLPKTKTPEFGGLPEGPEYSIEASGSAVDLYRRDENGPPNGRGTILHADHRYTGEFINGIPAGRGELFIKNDGTIIEGIF